MHDDSLPRLCIRRVILFARDVPALAAFYQNVLGLCPIGLIESEWAQFDTGSCILALHRGGNKVEEKSRGHPKFVFAVEDVPSCRATMIRRGVDMGKVHHFDGIAICDGKDPEGNSFQISSRP